MICVSLTEPTAAACRHALNGLDLAEIRLERMRIGPEGVRRIFSRHRRLVATCRPGVVSEKRRLALLRAAIRAGAAYVDIELEAGDGFREGIIRAELERTIILARSFGADIVKIACLVRARRDSARLLGLLDSATPLIVVGMGEKGKLTRLAAPLLGSVFTYASLGEGKETAEGQWEAASLRRILLELTRHARA
jgi:3-dehydroquinate dehydratase-1